MIEGETAALAARNARKADIVALREKIARMREHADDADGARCRRSASSTS